MVKVLHKILNILIGFGLALLLGLYLESRQEHPLVLPNLPLVGVKEFNSPQHLSPIFILQRKEIKSGKLYNICTAWVFDANYAITAAHCIWDNEREQLSKNEYRAIVDGRDAGIQLKAVGVSGQMDYALVMGDFADFRPMTPNFSNLLFKFKQDEPLYTCGYPMGQSELECTPFVPMGSDAFAVAGVGSVYPGMSGGPVFYPTTGEVVAVITASPDNRTVVTPLVGFLGAMGIESK